MSGIPPELLNQIRQVLLEIEQFKAHNTLSDVFADGRLRLWQTGLPKKNNQKDRVNATINYLHGKYNDQYGENGLVLLMTVLADQLEPADNRYRQLLQLRRVIKEHERQAREKPIKSVLVHASGRRYKIGAVVVSVIMLGIVISILSDDFSVAEIPTSDCLSVPPASPHLGQLFWNRPDDDANMVYVPGGTFYMGAEDGSPDELRPHRVELTPFWIDQMEVTVQQFTAFLKACGSTDEDGNSWLDSRLDVKVLQEKDGQFEVVPVYTLHPITGVTWYAANHYCQWVGAELPTEAQWEYAARGEEGTTYPWGNEFSIYSLANFDNEEGTQPVNSYENGRSWANAYNMAGNVWEWVADWYDSDYYERSPFKDPFNSQESQTKVLRGGSWLSSAEDVRMTNRDNEKPERSRSDLGFRCAINITD